MGKYWHPFADMGTVSSAGEFVVERGEGVNVWDDVGRKYLDAMAGLWYCNVGFGRQEIADAAAAQMRTLPAYSNFGDFATRPTLELAERLSALAPTPESVVFFTSNGSDSVDTAVKLVRRYWQVVGQPRRSTLIVRDHAYHGMHVGGTGLSGINANSAGYEDILSGVVRVPWNSADVLAKCIDEIGNEQVAAFFCEPVIGAGGVFAAPPGYLAAVRQICRDRGVLFVADEVITGFGRVGAWFASTRWQLEPDLLLCAKGLTSGYLPMGAVLVAPEVAEPFWAASGPGIWRHGYTYSGHATVAAAALANLAIIEREGLVERVAALQDVLADVLAPIGKHPLVGEVRAGTGLLGAVQIDDEAQKADPKLPAKVALELRENGVLSRVLAGGALQISPAFVITEHELEQLATAIYDALEAVS